MANMINFIFFLDKLLFNPLKLQLRSDSLLFETH